MNRWRGSTWTALLSQEPYGLHFSVSAQGRIPTDDEVLEAALDKPSGHPVALDELTEVTSWHQSKGALNPWVRHYVPTAHAKQIGVA